MTCVSCNSVPRRLRIGSMALLLALLVIAGNGRVEATEIIAHRGASFDAPENTLASVQLAWEQKADAVEIDIYLSSDHQIVVTHDATLKRFGGPNRKVEEMPFEEIRAVDVGKWKDPKFTGEKVPLFADVLKSIPSGHRLFIEIKSGPAIVPHLVSALKQANRPAQETCIIAFNPDVIAATVKALPELQHYWLVSMDSGKDKQAPTAAYISETAKRLGANGVDIGGKTDRIDEALIDALTKANLPCYIWTVNDPQEALRLARFGVKGITTDKPAVLRAAGVADIVVEE